MNALVRFRVGEGKTPAVLLHGFLGSGRNLRTLATRWSQAAPSLTVLVPDLTGHGESPPFGEDPTLEAVARDVLATARDEGLDGALIWAGHSFGGRVALAAARVAPEAVARIDLLDIAPRAYRQGDSESAKVLEVLAAAPERAESRAAMRALLAERLSPALADWLVMNLMPDGGGGVRWRIDRQALLRAQPQVLGESLWDVVESRTVPIRCLRGARSPYVDDQDVPRLEANGCPVKTVEAGHYVHVEALDEVVDWLAS